MTDRAQAQSFGSRRGGTSARAGGGRDAAYAALGIQAGRFPRIDLATEPRTEGLEPRDAALAHAIYDGAIRRWFTLSHVLGAYLQRPVAQLDAKVLGALLGGATQLLLMDRVPPHAVINETVEWTKHRASRKASGLVNAVLRKVATLREQSERIEQYTGGPSQMPLADGEALAFGSPVFPEHPGEQLAIATGVPRWLVERWKNAHGADGARRLSLHTLVRAPTVLCVAYAESPVDEEAGLSPHVSPGHRVFAGSRAELGELLARRRDLWVQDAGSSVAIESVGDLKPGVIVDVCAGQGTKTRQLAAAFPDARIVATDPSRERFAELTAQFEGSERVSVRPFDGFRMELVESADLVLLDVPCSNTGVLARRTEAKYRFDGQALKRLTETQRQIIADAIPLLAPGGKLLYSTCSLEREENEEQAAWAGQWHQFRVERQKRSEPVGMPGGAPDEYRDGAFSVLLGR